MGDERMAMTQAPPPIAETPELLQAALEKLRLEGAIFFRSALTEAFAFESVPAELADGLHPGAERIILFHIVTRGNDGCVPYAVIRSGRVYRRTVWYPSASNKPIAGASSAVPPACIPTRPRSR